VRWGNEVDVRQLDPDERREVAGYLAKYATKSTERARGLLHRIDAEQLDAAPVRGHVRSFMRSAFELHERAAARRPRPQPRPPEPSLDVEADWNLCAPALRVNRAISHGGRSACDGTTAACTTAACAPSAPSNRRARAPRP
jgi:hypothetical protein